MGGTFFGFNPGTHNNAPPPVPISGSVGTNMPGGGGKAAMPGFPVLGPPTGPSANQPVFGGSGIQTLNSGLPGAAGNFNALADAFGSGTANMLISILGGGLFNPQVASSFLNSMQPGINRGVAQIQNSFGAEGSRFGSSAALGIGDYLSQVNLNEEQTLANMFLTSQGEELNLLQNLLPTIHSERANSGGILSDILGGLEIAGGIGSMFVPGLQGLGGALISGGIGTVAGQGKGGGGGSVPQIKTDPMITDVWGTNKNAAGMDASVSGGYNPNNVANSDVLQNISAGSTLGGADPFSTDGSSGGDFSNLFPFLFGN